MGPLRLLDLDEVRDLPEHTGELRALRVLHGLADARQAERAERAAVPLRLADLAVRLRDADLAHGDTSGSGGADAGAVDAGDASSAGAGSSGMTRGGDSIRSALVPGTAGACSGPAPAAAGSLAVSSASGFAFGTGRTWLIVSPRVRATSSGRRRRRRPSTVAFSMLIGFVVPRLLARMSWMPPSSSTARTPPPAMTPVPSLAGRRRTRAAPNSPRISCVIVWPCFGTVKRFFFASSTAFEIASGTSRAFP